MKMKVHTKQDYIKRLVKRGYNPEDATKKVGDHYDRVEQCFKESTLTRKCKRIIDLASSCFNPMTD